MISERGKIDILVNNALLRTTTSPDISTEELELSMKVNAVGVINIIRIISEEMKKRKSGVIINISSIYGVLGCDPCLYEKTEVKMAGPDYYFNKAGIINITRYYASLLGAYNIRVNCISPGGLFSNQDPKFVEKYNKKNALEEWLIQKI